MTPASDPTQIAAPAMKAASAIGAGAGTSIITTALAQPGHFLPTDLAGWMALAASTAACVYTLHLMGEWYWKKVLRGWLVRHGWIRGRVVLSKEPR